ncbi:MAG: tetratricopeptide repeat protein [Pseudomonadota bacterium]
MSDDSFIREVDEDLRNQQFKDFWGKYKWLLICGAVAIVAATAGYRGWDYYTQKVAGESGDRFIQAIELSNEGNHAEAIEVLEQLGKDGVGEYPALASIRLAAEYAKQGDVDKAVSAFDQIAGDISFDETLRNVARLRAGLLLVDHGSYDEVVSRLQTMANTGQPFRHSSREGLGLSAWKHRKFEDAHRWFTAVAEDAEAPGGIRSRATIMLELLAGKGVKAATG